MAKLSQEQIDAIPGLAAAQRSGDIVFLNLDTDDTSPTLTEGFDDVAIKAMDGDALRRQLESINKEEKNLTNMLADARARRNSVNRILARKTEIS